MVDSIWLKCTVLHFGSPLDMTCLPVKLILGWAVLGPQPKTKGRVLSIVGRSTCKVLSTMMADGWMLIHWVTNDGLSWFILINRCWVPLTYARWMAKRSLPFVVQCRPKKLAEQCGYVHLPNGGRKNPHSIAGWLWVLRRRFAQLSR